MLQRQEIPEDQRLVQSVKELNRLAEELTNRASSDDSGRRKESAARENRMPTRFGESRRDMKSAQSHWAFRPARSPAAVMIYLAGFVALLLVVSRYYLMPALAAYSSADPQRRKVLAAHALLILSLFLLILFLGLLFTFRIGRFFTPRTTPRAKPTTYVDAWSESAKRLKLPEKTEEE